MIDWSLYPNFAEPEFACKCGCGRADMDPDFMGNLQTLRNLSGFPFVITSGFRCPAHNTAIGGGPAHVLGKAADIQVHGGTALQLLEFADYFTGIGVHQKGDVSSRFIHLDTLANGEGGAPRPWIWSY